MWGPNEIQSYSRPNYNYRTSIREEFQPTVTESERGRYYTVPGGNTYPSVTTFLSQTKSDFDKQVLTNWKEGIGEDNAKRKTEKAAERGSLLHETIETFLMCPFEIEAFKTDTPLFKKFYPELCKIDNIRACETFLYSHKLKLAGRVDCVADYNGVLSIIDFKTSTKEKEEWEIEDYYLQETCYAIMYAELYNVKITQIVTLIGCERTMKDAQVFIKKPVDYLAKLLKRVNSFNNTRT